MWCVHNILFIIIFRIERNGFRRPQVRAVFFLSPSYNVSRRHSNESVMHFCNALQGQPQADWSDALEIFPDFLLRRHPLFVISFRSIKSSLIKLIMRNIEHKRKRPCTILRLLILCDHWNCNYINWSMRMLVLTSIIIEHFQNESWYLINAEYEEIIIILKMIRILVGSCSHCCNDNNNQRRFTIYSSRHTSNCKMSKPWLAPHLRTSEKDTLRFIASIYNNELPDRSRCRLQLLSVVATATERCRTSFRKLIQP